ncbi:agmatine deiminase family protein [Sulfurimonas sp. SWIR-19]|uniref:agmatine deiminase family protein n=1 Tax=Sulfurimonas sp. SWIR-19 TaxID=2878390 RepID=UPI001CF2D4DC|nr:agmatine deiminase family protein [Sulfurimonas sp. SWIR-19]UCN00677.1 agmatine deiminase family protein [Sulfurimonas sp. SWIR-19]
MKEKKRLIAEFEEQSFTQIIFPHADTDWADYLEEAQNTFVNIINAIRKYQKCLVVSHDTDAVKKHFSDTDNLEFVEYMTDDTWARDCCALCVAKAGKTTLLDFTFNGWGNKFDAKKDNLMTQNIAHKYLPCKVETIDFVLEGGAVESNGAGTVLTTAACMHNKNRNPQFTAKEITKKLQEFFGAEQILYLHHGYLAGDDTDSHIDTLARFIDENTIMYVTCKDTNDEHYKALKRMEEELQMLAKEHNFRLIALPMCDAIYFEGERLPATYANFLFVNGAVLVPVYGVAQDQEALKIFKQAFPDKEIAAIDCSVLIRQHGSLHCVTMNFSL